MGFKLISFADTLPLPNFNAEYDNNASVRTVSVSLPGGWLNLYRGQKLRMAQMRLSARGYLVNEKGSLPAYMKQALGYVGTYGVLRRQWVASTGDQQINAVLEDVSSTHIRRNLHQVTCTFVTDEDHWGGYFVGLPLSNYAESWTLGAGRLLGEGLISGPASNNNVTLALTNDGTVAVLDPKVMVRAVGGTLTKVRCYQNLNGVRLTDWRVTATIPPGSELVVDCGRQSVTLDGDPAWGGFEFLSGHSVVDWVVIPPGGINLYVELTGSNTAHVASAGAYRYAYQ